MVERFKLDGRVAVVTGAYAWLGAEIASAFATAGADVVITSRDASRAESAAANLATSHPGVEALGVPLEVTDWESVESAFRSIHEWRGRIHVLVNNAGGGSGQTTGNIFDRPPEAIAAMINVNLTGAIWCCKAVAPYMRAAETGSIINIASIAGLVGRDRRLYAAAGINSQPADYAAAKAGITGVTRDLAAELGPFGIRVNAISPGGFDKGVLPENFVEGYAERTILGRWGTIGEDLGGAAIFLASDASSYVTGQNIVVDGGFSIFK